jgi:tripartite-type tricarboxylate transporter receptor subunit TctC
MKSLLRTAFLALGTLALPATAWAQASYPARPIRMIVPFAPGGASDVVARVMAMKVGEALGQQIVVENRSGASGNIGMEAAANAPPDGYTIFLGNIGTMAINPAIFRNMSVNPVKDFIAVTQVADVPSILIAHPGVPANSVAELIALAKAQPGTLNFASTGSGALSRLEMEQFRRVAGIDVVHIPYKGGAGPAITGMLGGETHVMFVTLASAISLIKAGKLKPLGISTVRRIDALPQVPTMTEAGFPQMVSGSWQGVFVPAGTPRPVVNKLHAALVATLGAPETVDRLATSGVWVVTSRSPGDFAAFVEAEAVRWSKVARESGATVD